MLRTFLLLLLAFAGAVLIGAALTSVVSTQLNLASIQSMGLPVSFGVRAQTTWADLLGIFPMLAMVLAELVGDGSHGPFAWAGAGFVVLGIALVVRK